VKVRQISLNRGIPQPMRHLSSDRWYNPSAWVGETFLLLTEGEAELLDWEILSIYGLKLSRELSFGGFRIMVFAENLARYVPGWDRKYEQRTKFPVTTHSLSHVGELREGTKEWPLALVSEAPQVGALHFGPYIDVAPGLYSVMFEVEAAHSPNGAVRLDVASAPDQAIFGEIVLNLSGEAQEILFRLDEPRTMEFRVWALGNVPVKFRGFSMQRVAD
jgi:hypothetical protein